MTARKPPRCGAGTPAKSTYCDLSSFGPALFEICWPDIYLGGPYGPVKDEMYWPELVRRSEKCAGPVLMSRAEFLGDDKGMIYQICLNFTNRAALKTSILLNCVLPV